MGVLDEILTFWLGISGAVCILVLGLATVFSWLCFTVQSFAVSWKWGVCCLLAPFPSIFIFAAAFYSRVRLAALISLWSFMAYAGLAVFSAITRFLYSGVTLDQFIRVMLAPQFIVLDLLLLPLALFAILGLRIHLGWGVSCLLIPFPAVPIFVKRYFTQAKIPVLVLLLIISPQIAFFTYTLIFAFYLV
jgi:hypothetical protein